MTRRELQLFALAGFLWGIPYLLIKVAVSAGGFNPAFLVFARLVLGAALLLPLAAQKKVIPKGGAVYRYLIAYAILEFVGPWYFISKGERSITSGLAGLLIATVPFWSTILAYLLGDKSVLQRHRILGMVVGFSGVVLVVGLEAFKGHNSIGAIAIILLAAIGYTIAPMMIRLKAPELNGLAVNSVALAIAALIFLPVGIWQWPSATPTAKSIWALIALAIFPTAIAFVTYFAVMSSLGPTRASLVTYVNTAVAVLLGIAILHERLTMGVALGLPLILIGSYLASKKRAIR